MTGLCIIGAGKTIVLAIAAFTLSWTHSVERTRWQEDWTISAAGLELAEARIEGSGAGMEPPQGARLSEGWWVYAPNLPPQSRIVLAASGATGTGWLLCSGQPCLELGAESGEPLVLEACRASDH